MGEVFNPGKAFGTCEGYVDDELYLWSDGVLGMLADEQEKKCERIVLKNVRKDAYPVTTHSVKKALTYRDKSNSLPSRAKVWKTFARCSHKYEGLSTPEFQEKVGQCVDQAIITPKEVSK